ncbi:MAG: hypothetical protein A4E37_02096 [Methanoregulaceae archaeon PtaB.Bin056]|jgi:uncharacterized membrane protein YphA (DoxX/SURF4 family)|nr:MAG: hypothetical protein A4E37_02096 [Methanoregulaceae archaeon PtaB.Bin056]
MGLMDFIWPVFFPALGAIVALVHIFWKRKEGMAVIRAFLMWQLAIGLGLSYIYAGFGHLVFPDQVAASIGWPPGSPFQREVGLWDFAIGIVGLLCLKFRSVWFWTAIVIAFGIFSIGAGIGHVYELVVHGDVSINNAGPVMYVDLLYPIVLGVLLFLSARRHDISDSTRIEAD